MSAAEEGCDHPLARAFRRVFPAPEGLRAESIERLTGAGLRADVEGRHIVVGNLALMQASGVEVPADFAAEARAHAAAGLTPVLVADGERVTGLAAFGDDLHELGMVTETPDPTKWAGDTVRVQVTFQVIPSPDGTRAYKAMPSAETEAH